MWIARTILAVAVLSATLVGIRAMALAGRRLASAILPVVAVVTRVVCAWPAFLGSLSLVGFIVHPRDTMRVASGRSVTIAVFVPMSLSIMYTVVVVIIIILSVLRRERAVGDPTHCVRLSTLSLTKDEGTGWGRFPCVHAKVSPDLPIPSKRSVRTHGSPVPARTQSGLRATCTTVLRLLSLELDPNASCVTHRVLTGP